MKYLKKYQFDSQNSDRDLLGTVFDVEERLIFDVYVCPRCQRSEFIYQGAKEGFDDN